MTEDTATYDAGTLPTPQLDPAAVEAIARKLYESGEPLNQSWDYGSVDFEWTDPYITHERERIEKFTAAAITAYIAAIEPQLRERVETFAESYDKHGRNAERFRVASPDIVQACIDAHEHLFALFGLEAE